MGISLLLGGPSQQIQQGGSTRRSPPLSTPAGWPIHHCRCSSRHSYAGQLASLRFHYKHINGERPANAIQGHLCLLLLTTLFACFNVNLTPGTARPTAPRIPQSADGNFLRPRNFSWLISQFSEDSNYETGYPKDDFAGLCVCQTTLDRLRIKR